MIAALLLASLAVYDGGAPRVEELRAAGIERVLLLDGAAPPAGLPASPPDDSMVVIRDALWPRLRPHASLDQDRDAGFANATAEPWIDSNGWRVLYTRGVAPGKSIVLAYGPGKDARPRPGSTALAVAEAAVFGATYAVPSSEPARADWSRTRTMLRFVAEHGDWFRGASLANIAVLAERLEPIAEVMNLLVRRNLPFVAFRRDAWPAEAPAVALLIGQRARAAGVIVIERKSVADPSRFAVEVRQALGDRRPFRLTNAQHVIGHLVAAGPGRRTLHLLNYGLDPVQDVRVHLAAPAERATLFAPGDAAHSLAVRGGEFALPEFGAYAAVLLEN